MSTTKLKIARLTPEENQRELERLRDMAKDRIRKMPYVYRDWGVVRTRAYRRQLERLQKYLTSTDKRASRVIANIRNALGSLDTVGTSTDMDALNLIAHPELRA